MKHIVLISCVSKKQETKNSGPIPAKDLYISPLFKKALEYATTLSPDYIYILSAEHHLLPLDKEVEKYDKTLNKMSAEECKQWSQEVLTEFKAKGHDLEKDKFTFLAGDKYCKYILRENSIKNAHQVYKENDLKGIGYILRFLTHTNDNNNL